MASRSDAHRGYRADQREPGGDRQRGLESRNEARRGLQMPVRREDRTRQEVALVGLIGVALVASASWAFGREA
jgi:hypothetical protein